MNIAGVAGQVYSRLSGDTTLTGLATVRHFYTVLTEQETSRTPYVVFTIDLGSHTHSTRGETWELIVTVMVKSPRETTFQTVTDIMDRIHGDATNQLSLSPTYGLHRWTGTLSTGSWTMGTMYCSDGSSITDDPDWFMYTMEYRCHVSREAPTS